MSEDLTSYFQNGKEPQGHIGVVYLKGVITNYLYTSS